MSDVATLKTTIPVQPKVFIDIKLLDSSRYIKGLSHLHTVFSNTRFSVHSVTQSYMPKSKIVRLFFLFTHAKTQIKSYALSVR